MAHDLHEHELRNITDEWLLFALEDVFPSKLTYRELHEHTRFSEWAIRRSMKRLEALGFVNAEWQFQQKPWGKLFRVKQFKLNGPVMEVAQANFLNEYFLTMDSNKLLFCSQCDPTSTQQFRAEDRWWDPDGGCLTGCGVRIQCFHDNKEGSK